jgi:hypothetical protein
MDGHSKDGGISSSNSNSNSNSNSSEPKVGGLFGAVMAGLGSRIT